jgi:hypothetical protein
MTRDAVVESTERGHLASCEREQWREHQTVDSGDLCLEVLDAPDYIHLPSSEGKCALT